MLKFIAATVLLTAPTLFAEINPRYYVEMQKKSPERLRITVTQVKNEPCDNCETFNTEVTAVVTKVICTKSKIKKGRAVRFSYAMIQDMFQQIVVLLHLGRYLGAYNGTKVL